MSAARVWRGAVLGLLAASIGTEAAAPLPAPAHLRKLRGEAARRAADLVRRIARLERTGRFREALGPARELATLRAKLQGPGHWEARETARRVKELERAARLPE